MKNLFQYIFWRLKKQKEWDIDWCTHQQFLEHCQNLWKLNRDRLYPTITFEGFYTVQKILLHKAPSSFKLIINHDFNKLK